MDPETRVGRERNANANVQCVKRGDNGPSRELYISSVFCGISASPRLEDYRSDQSKLDVAFRSVELDVG
jgi:hypothetical protein